MTKEQKIKEAFGESWNRLTISMQKHILEVHHWVDRSQNRMNLSPEDLGFNEKTECEVHCEFWRPIQLKGIENNNGWIKIEREDDFPDEDVLVCNINGNKITFFHDALKPFGKKYTHYQPIEKPKPPIY
ncbi:hypothetical protein [Chryseobacterium vrystaatense]|uniref:Uncharacterized protein n=1 Tax=Chryseobacterium vrystaatense TaxID=307480 RepID=A0ABR4UJB9_9FLAO|nr:hypothetical protein [Chryseobacterium vrystaatense]KFF24741.1 hypothetical protein IW16_17555 [Chryseobacterium vrystaatense]